MSYQNHWDIHRVQYDKPNLPLPGEAEFSFPEISDHLLHDGVPNPVTILSAGEHNEMVLLQYSGIHDPHHGGYILPGDCEVILEPAEALALYDDLGAWMDGRNLLE